jgi:hypothetical protein
MNKYSVIARALLKVEWDADVQDGIGYCPACGISRHHALNCGHRSGCELDEDLKIADLTTEAQREAAREELILESGNDWRRASRDEKKVLS